jgi:phenylacetate-CoA ligase
MTTQETKPVSGGTGGYFKARPIDDSPHLLENSYGLRYQVYCVERKFLRAEDYPQGLEFDEFDRHSIHVGAVDSHGELAGTARVVKVSELGLPLFHHCKTFPDEMAKHPPSTRLVEVGRLSVSRSYRRRADDDEYGVTKPLAPGQAPNRRAEMRRARDGVFPTLLKALYQATKRMGATHWLAGMEKSLIHLLALQGLPFRMIGPESDYFGLVAPYQMDLKEFDQIILSGEFPALDAFVIGLEPEFGPQSEDPAPAVAAPATDRSEDQVASSTSSEIEIDPPVFGPDTEARLVAEVRRAAGAPAYRALLEEHGVPLHHVRDFASFSRWCPLLAHANTFKRFALASLSVGGALHDVADVLTSSGHGGKFSFGVISRKQAEVGPQFLDLAFDAAFGIASRRTLAINCLPMGVIFSSHLMTVATTSVREDMAVALVETFGHYYDQILLVGDPLFMKKFTDYAADRGLEWSRYRVNVIIGEEVFGEHYRGYLAACLGLNVDQPDGDGGYIMSSFGVGELGLHLCYETKGTIGLRRALFNSPSFARELVGIGRDEGYPLPMIFSFNPLRTFIEVIEPDEGGFGRMTTSMLDPDRPVPLLRYQTGDIVRLLDRGQVAAMARRHGVDLAGNLPQALIAVRGREREALPNGAHAAFYKDALYADHRIARRLSGAFRVTFTDGQSTMHVQLARTTMPASDSLEPGILHAIPSHVRPDSLVLWPYADFPFGMSLDYERKFAHYVAATPNAPD